MPHRHRKMRSRCYCIPGERAQQRQVKWWSDRFHNVVDILNVIAIAASSNRSSAVTRPLHPIPVKRVPPRLPVRSPAPSVRDPGTVSSSDAQWLTNIQHPSVIAIIGSRDSGKSATGYKLLELFRPRAAPYVVGAPGKIRKLLPIWIGLVGTLDEVPENSVVLVDEAYLQFGSRNSMSATGRKIGELVNLSRQRNITIIFVAQEARQMDVNVISQADVLVIKELTEISRDFERKELRRFTDKARKAFSELRGNRRQFSWVFTHLNGEVGVLQNGLASFWSSALSRAFAGPPSDDPSDGFERIGSRLTRADLKIEVKRLRRLRPTVSFGKIEKMLGISKSHAHRLASEPD